MSTNIKSKNNKTQNKFKEILIFISFEIVFTVITIVPFTLYGPFKSLRNIVVSTIVGTGAHQYIAKWFFSDAQIKEITKEESKSEITKNNKTVKTVKVKYNDDGIAYSSVSTDKFDAKVLVIKNPKRVKIGYADQIGYVGDTTHAIAKKYKAVAAINGGYYEDTSGNGTGAFPTGFVISDGKIVYPKDESKWDKKSYDVMSIDEDGTLSVGKTYSANELIKNNIKNALVTGPYIIKDGKNDIQSNNVTGVQPRTVIGQKEDKSIIFLTIDGRGGLTKMGAELQDVQNIMKSFNVINAICLDGGGSTTMYYNGEVVNNPSSATGERSVPDILYVEQ